MSYRIQVDTEAVSLLRTLAPHVLVQLSSALADVAAALGEGEDAETTELSAEGCVLQYQVDHARRLVQVVRVEAYTPAQATG